MKKIYNILIIIIILLLLTILITNVIYNMSEKYSEYSYECCDYENGTRYWEFPCKCKSNINVFEKTLIVLGIKEN